MALKRFLTVSFLSLAAATVTRAETNDAAPAGLQGSFQVNETGAEAPVTHPTGSSDHDMTPAATTAPEEEGAPLVNDVGAYCTSHPNETRCLLYLGAGGQDRKPELPLKNFEDCARQNDIYMRGRSMPSRSPEVNAFCKAHFRGNAPVDGSLVFSGFTSADDDSVRASHSRAWNLTTSRATVVKLSKDLNEKYADQKALQFCRDYAQKNGMNGDKCRVAARFDSSHTDEKVLPATAMFPTPEKISGAWVAKSLVVLDP